jgi:hypothetical protein
MVKLSPFLRYLMFLLLSLSLYFCLENWSDFGMYPAFVAAIWAFGVIYSTRLERNRWALLLALLVIAGGVFTLLYF